jgi:hypothetical protein
MERIEHPVTLYVKTHPNYAINVNFFQKNAQLRVWSAFSLLLNILPVVDDIGCLSYNNLVGLLDMPDCVNHENTYSTRY